jgi:NADPH:quinone reductase-like Zn-dependent oxidoreductase
MFLAGLPSRRTVVFFIAKFDKADVVVLHDLLEAAKVIPAIDRSYPLDEIVDALEYLGDGHAHAKIVVTM